MSSVTPQSILFLHQGIMRFSQIPVLCIKSICKKLLICAYNTENRSSSNTDRVFVQIYTVCPRACRSFPGVIIVQAFGIQVANKLQVLTVMSTVLRNHLSINNCFTEILEVNLFAFCLLESLCIKLPIEHSTMCDSRRNLNYPVL